MYTQKRVVHVHTKEGRTSCTHKREWNVYTQKRVKHVHTNDCGTGTYKRGWNIHDKRGQNIHAEMRVEHVHTKEAHTQQPLTEAWRYKTHLTFHHHSYLPDCQL